MKHTHQLINLSLQGIKYGALLPAADVKNLYHKLYGFNTVPVPVTLRQKKWDHQSVFSFYAEYDAACNLLQQHWAPLFNEGSSNYWLSWKPQQEIIHNIAPGNCTFKLYVSPVPQQFLPVLAATIKAITNSNVYCFKTGSNIHGIFRPDKIVVYFNNLSDLENAAEKINAVTRQFSAQGVPFTAPLFQSTMLSWGIDPPTYNNEPVSWRVWITKLLAAGIIEGKKMLVDEPWKYALKYMEDKGLNNDTWQPGEKLFQLNQS